MSSTSNYYILSVTQVEGLIYVKKRIISYIPEMDFFFPQQLSIVSDGYFPLHFKEKSLLMLGENCDYGTVITE